ncbi:CU044_5270 family protein [Kribbella sp. NPDC056951]|uniref:CU044_5270 family protein n=1 Tax=Kribbella sp. NPDC056951 TaxID=3345978 RepID=UPI003643511C
MNELESIRKAFPENDGPSPEASAAARRQLQSLIHEEKHRSRSTLARVGWIGGVVTATTAVVTVVALGVPLLQGPGSGGDVGVAPATLTPPRLASASEVLIAAAVKQEADEKVSGKYFLVRTLHVDTGTRVGSPKYTLKRQSITERWMPMKPGVRSWFGWVELGYKPATPGDEAKWRAQGSPTSWVQSELVDPITAAPTRPVVNQMSFEDVPPGYYLSGDKPLTAEQIAALPTDPVKLRAVLARGTGAETEELRDYSVYTAAGRLLFEAPSPPKLRGAALRVLSMIPGVTIQQNVKDPLGRSGTRISLITDFGRVKPGAEPSAQPTLFSEGRVDYIIDPVHGRLLASETFGMKRGADIVLESGWTDERPTPPSTAIR